MRKKRFASSFAAVLVLLSLVSATPLISKVIAQGTSCNDIPALKVSKEAPATAEYRVWALVKAETATAKPYLRVNEGACHELALPTSGDWGWVESKSGAIREQLTLGSHDFYLSVNGGAVLMDKILITNDLACVPQRDGTNCIEEQLDFVIEGIENNSTVSGERVIRVTPTTTQLAAATFEFYIDDQLVGTQSAAPYCMVDDENANCAMYNFSQLSDGDYQLRVLGNTLGGQTKEKIVNFKIGSANSLPPTTDNGGDPVSGNGNTPPAPTVPQVTVQLIGVTDKETLSGKRVISATVTGTDRPVGIEFALNGGMVNNSTSSPYCMKYEGSACGEWDTATIVNGDYVLSAKAFIDNQLAGQATVNVTINNAAPVVVTAPTKQEVVVGNSNQQASGNVQVTIPKAVAAKPRATTVTYKVDDKVVATTYANNPVATVDTTTLSNGNKKFVAEIDTSDGEKQVLTSDVKVRNDALTGTSNWFRENIVAALFIGLISVAGLYFIIRFVVGAISKRQLMSNHNLMDTYSYIQPQEQAVMQHQAVHGFAALALFALGAVSIMQLGQVKAGVGFGFVLDIDDTGGTPTQQFDVTTEWADNMEFRYVRLNYSVSTNNPTPPTTPPTTTPPATPPATPPTTPPATPPTGTNQNAYSGPTYPSVHTGSGTGPYINNAALPAPQTQNYKYGRQIGPPYLPTLYPDSIGAFRTSCRVSHFSYDDPIVHPGRPGMAHLHMFFGNTGVNAFSTTDSLLASSSSTCSGGTINNSAYWVPAVIDTNGNVVQPIQLLVYYKTAYNGVRPEQVQIPPRGLRMIAGSATSTAPQGNHPNGGDIAHFSCNKEAPPHGPADWSTGSGVDIVCPEGQRRMFMEIRFPQCWQNAGEASLDSWDHKSHMQYPTYDGGCPPSHPYAIAEIRVRVEFDYYAPGRTSWRLSSDNYSSSIPGGYSTHADWWNGWEESTLQIIKQNCWNASIDCQVNHLNNGTMLY